LYKNKDESYAMIENSTIIKNDNDLFNYTFCNNISHENDFLFNSILHNLFNVSEFLKDNTDDNHFNIVIKLTKRLRKFFLKNTVSIRK